jgi:UDP-N-acetyl-D-mannosaminuronic acid dehydrogenase
MKKICVVGLGYIGLPTASLLATKGFDVHGVDVTPAVVDTINSGRIHIREPELDVLVKSAVQSGRLKAALKPSGADIFVLAVPTPFKDGFAPDLSYVEAATRSICPYVKAGDLVLLESTSPVGTTESVARWIGEERKDLVVPTRGQDGRATPENGILVAHSPERVLPGQILRELVENDRVVGGVDSDSTKAAAAFYRSFVSGSVLETDSRTAEMAKLTENTFRDVNIAFANELSLICEELEIDVWELIELANHHPRVKILRPGPGVGGHCIAVDPWFIVDSSPKLARVIRTAREVNHAKPEHVLKKVKEKAALFRNPVIACLGLAYKPDIDDLRESPAMEITQRLAAEKVGRVFAVEPNLDELPNRPENRGIELVDLQTAFAKADIVVGLVGHRAFRQISAQQLQEKVVIDTCGIWR